MACGELPEALTDGHLLRPESPKASGLFNDVTENTSGSERRLSIQTGSSPKLNKILNKSVFTGDDGPQAVAA